MNNKWTHEKPSQSGYYYYATCEKDWDLYRPVAVQSISDSNGRRFEVYMDPAGYSNRRWINVDLEEFTNSIWWGPLPRPERFGE